MYSTLYCVDASTAQHCPPPVTLVVCEKREQPQHTASTASTIDRRVVFHPFLLLLLVSIFRRFRAFIFSFPISPPLPLSSAFRFPRRPKHPSSRSPMNASSPPPKCLLLFGILSRNLTTSGIAAQKEKGSRQRARAHVVHGISRCERVACSTRNDVRVRVCFS